VVALEKAVLAAFRDASTPGWALKLLMLLLLRDPRAEGRPGSGRRTWAACSGWTGGQGAAPQGHRAGRLPPRRAAAGRPGPDQATNHARRSTLPV